MKSPLRPASSRPVRARFSAAAMLLCLACGLREHPRGPPRTQVRRDAGPPAVTADAAREIPTVDIAGTLVPRDKAIVFLHFGHSNMAGLARSPTSLRSYHFDPAPNLWSYRDGQFTPAKEPTAPDPPGHLGAGPGMAWLRSAAAAAGPDYHFISIARARGGAPSVDFLKNGLYYPALIEPALELKGRVTFGGIFIMMGITDRHMPEAEQDGFPDRMARIIADLRAELDEPDLPVLHTEYEVESTGYLAIDQPVGMKFNRLVALLPERISNLALIPTAGVPMRDDHHFDMAGQKLWAERGIQIMIDRGWFPWTPP
jgi:hypothetical protein